MRVCCLFVAIFAYVASVFGDDHIPYPSQEKLTTAHSQVRSLFKNEITRAAGLSEVAAVVKSLIDIGSKTNDDDALKVSTYLLAQELAIQGGEFELALETVDRIASEFKLDSLKAEVDVLQAGLVGKLSDSQQIQLLGCFSDVVEKLVANERLDEIRGLVDKLKENETLRSKPQVVRWIGLSSAIELNQDAYTRALTNLKDGPANPESSYIVGKFKCMILGDWQNGIWHLSQSNDNKLRQIAILEQKPRKDANDLIHSADAWTEIEATLAGHEKEQVGLHARSLYLRALPLIDGVTKVRVQQILGGTDPTNVEPKAGDVRDDNSLGAKLNWIPPGKFQMGSKAVEVSITNGFWIGQTELTQGQWRKLRSNSPWNEGERKGEVKKFNADYPATGISWVEARQFCKDLTKVEVKSKTIPTNWEYRLPTEAEWEMACRAGTKTRFSFGDDISAFARFGWAKENSKGEFMITGKKRPNAFGLFDMHGNVYEWCADHFVGEIVGGEDPFVAREKGDVVGRGGDIEVSAKYCDSTARRPFAADRKVNGIGFRICLGMKLDSDLTP